MQTTVGVRPGEVLVGERVGEASFRASDRAGVTAWVLPVEGEGPKSCGGVRGTKGGRERGRRVRRGVFLQ